MDDGMTGHDLLPSALQAQLDRTLAGGENALMSLTGASGEALVVTDHRVLILREQMPVVGSDTQVDCFGYSYEQVQTVAVESAAGGGHLKLVLFAPPPDDHQVTLYFPGYEQAKFDMAAARIRLLVEQTRGVPLVPAAPVLAPAAVATGLQAAACHHCGAAVDRRDAFCSSCGAARAKRCGCCRGPVAPEAAFCPACGSPAAQAGDLACPRCGHSAAPHQAFCPACGRSQARICTRCGAAMGAAAAHCTECGQAADSVPTLPSPAGSGLDPAMPPAAAAPQTAEEHNDRGMRLYEQERYDEAVREFSEAIRISPDTPIYRCNLGVAYAEMGRDEDALAQYREASRIEPDDPAPYLNLGYFYAAREQMDDAKGYWYKTIQVAPDSPEAAEARQNLERADEV